MNLAFIPHIFLLDLMGHFMVSYGYLSKTKCHEIVLRGKSSQTKTSILAVHGDGRNGKRGGSVRKTKTLTMVLLSASIFIWIWGCTTPAGRTPGQVFDDGAITTTLKTKIYADSDLRGLGISVTTFKREVTLTGSVGRKSERKKVEKVAKSIKGVKRVHNRIKIQ
jgi:hypothetical protein